MFHRFIFAQVVALYLSCCLQAEIRRVPGQYSTIQAAVEAANDGDTIELEEGKRYSESIVVGNWPTWTKNLNFVGLGTFENRPIIDGTLKTFNNGGWFSAKNIRFQSLVYPWISGDTVFVDCEFSGPVSTASYGLAYINCLFLGNVEIQANISKSPVLIQNCTFAPSSTLVVQDYVNEGIEENNGVVAINTVFDGSFSYGRKKRPLTAINCYINKPRFTGNILPINPYDDSIGYRNESAKDYRLSSFGTWIDSGCKDQIFNDADGSIAGLGYGFGGRVGWIPVWVNEIGTGAEGTITRKLYNFSDKSVLIDLNNTPKGVSIQSPARVIAGKLLAAPFSNIEITIQSKVSVKSGDGLSQSISVNPMTVRYVASGEILQDAINSSTSGETILVGPGVYKERILISKPNLKIISASGASSTMIDGEFRGKTVIFSDANGTLFKGFTVSGGKVTDPTQDRGDGCEVRFCDPVIEDCVFKGNFGWNIKIAGNPVLRRTTFNYSPDAGGYGELVFGDNGTVGGQFYNCLFDGGTGSVVGYNGNAFPSFYNCTFNVGIAFLQIGTGMSYVANCAFIPKASGVRLFGYDNAEMLDWNPNLKTRIQISNSLIVGEIKYESNPNSHHYVIDGGGNLFAKLTDFIAPGSGNYTLQPGGAAINAGNSSILPDTDNLDLLGNTRIQGGKIDIGAYEAPVGQVFAWGENTYGQTNVPKGLSDILLVGGGERVSAAMRRDGSVLAWGDININNTVSSGTVLDDFRDLVALDGMNYLVGLRRDGIGVSQLKDAERLAVLQPVGKKVVSLDTGGNSHVLALYSDGSLGWAGPSDQSLTKPPTTIIDGLVEAQISGQFGLGLRSDGTLVAWQSGQLVDIKPYNDQAWYTAMPLKPPYSMISGGGGFLTGVGNQGSFWAWGNGSMSYSAKEKIAKISAGLHVMYGLSESGKVYALREPILPPNNLTNVVQVAAGGRHGLAIVSYLPAPQITADRSIKALVGENFRYQIPTTGSVEEYSAIGLPDWLNLDPKSGVLSGVITSPGKFRWRLTAVGPGGLDGRVVSVEFIPSYPVTTEVVNGSIQSGAGGFVFTMPPDGSYGRVWQEGVNLTAGVYTSEVVVDGPFNFPASSYFPQFTGGSLQNDQNVEYLSRHVKAELGNGAQSFTTRFRVLANGVGDYGLAMVNNPKVTLRRIRLTRESDGFQVLQDPNLTGVGGVWKGRADFGSAIGLIETTPSQTVYQSGSTVSLKAVPTRAFEFSQWIINGVPSGSANPLTLTVDAAKAVKAEFKVVRSLATNIKGAGRIDRSVVADRYADGTSVSLSAVPEKGWEFVGWTGGVTGSQPQLSLNLDRDQSVTAQFRPVFASIPPQAVEERLTWQLKLVAGDSSVVGHRLSYRLISGPAGVTIDSNTGAVVWTPGEADGGQSYDLQFAVTDTTDTDVGNQLSVRLVVAKLNHPPTLAAVPNASIPESTAWTYSLAGQDLDLPVQTITYALVNGPSGLSLDSATGVIRWSPTEAQGPGTYPVTVRVSDPDGLNAERTLSVTVTEANAAPVLAAIADQTSVWGKSIKLTLSATDTDEPANTLTYRLVSGPTNMTVSASGQLDWPPVRSQVPSTQVVTVAVSDGTASATQSFRIEAFDLVTLVNDVETTNAVATLPPAKVSFRMGRSDWLIFYSTDGSEPTASSIFYLDPFRITTSATVWPVAFNADFSQSVVGLPIAVSVLKPQTLTVTGANGLVHQGPAMAISATSDSGLPVTLTLLSGPARLEQGQLIPTGGGTVRLKATQTGDANWAPASIEVERVVAKAVQTIAWVALPEVTFGTAPIALKATASSGLPVSYQWVAGGGSVAGDRLTLTAAGNVTLRAIQAGNADFEASSADITLAVKKATQSLTFGGIADRVLSTDPIPLVANASSGLAVTFEVLSGPATVAGNQLTLTGVGTVVLRASQPGNGNYEAALPKDQQFAVTRGAQTLTFSPVGAKTFGDGPVTVSASSSANLPVTYRVLSGPGTLNGAVLSLVGAGDIVVQAVQPGSDRYQAASTSLTITVAKAAQTLTFPPLANVAYSTNAMVLDAKASSGLPLGYRVVNGPASVASGRLTLNGVGSVSIAADQEGNTNWLAAKSITNTFTVSRGVQAITFDRIGDTLLSAGSVTLSAVSSAGLPVTFTVMSGAATLSGGKLLLLSEGSVTVRALNPGSPLWLATQVDQTFQVRKYSTLTLAVAGNLGGTINAAPLKDQYQPTDTVTLTATAASGFAFGGWSGDLTGSANPATLTLASSRSVTATFKDIQPPVITWELPASGTTGSEQVRLTGRITDNAAGATALWGRNGDVLQALTVATNGVFAVENLILAAGTNRFTVVARDAAGNETRLERDVVWVPQRILQVADAVVIQEGQRMVFPISLSSPGDVAGLTFELKYDPAYLTDPQVEWVGAVGQSVNNVNIGTAGEITATFSMAGNALPAGDQRVATVSFRGRSVPAQMEVSLEPRWISASSATGALLASGNAVDAGIGRITTRRIKGDNNANQRIDIGDAVLISRLQVKLEEVRSWDVGLNDLNASGAIDNGDVVKALRAVVGLDPQPSPGSEGKRLAAALGLTKVLVNTNDVMALELVDGPTATVGQPYRVAVRLNRLKGSLSGLSFMLKYPASLTLTDKQVGALVPGDALPFWNESSGQVSLAAIRSTAWPNATGVAAVLTFVPSAAFTDQAEWPLRLEQSEITGSGFDVRPVDPVSVVIQSSGGSVDNRPQITLQPPKADGSLGLEIRAPAGATIAVETASDLKAWTETQRVTGQGIGSPVKVTLQADPNVQAKFWRVRVR